MTDYRVRVRSTAVCAPPTAPWTAAHKDEATRAILRLAVEQWSRGAGDGIDAPFLRGEDMVSETAFRQLLHNRAFGLTRDMIEAAVRTVRDFAEGRKIREVFWRVVTRPSPFQARKILYEGVQRPAQRRRGGVVVRVTRVRRLARAATKPR